MGTVEGEDQTVGLMESLGQRARVIDDRVSTVVYGARGGSLWPLSLVLVAGIAMLLDVVALGVVALLLLALWIGGRR